MSPMLWPENPVFESPAEKVVFEQLKILLGEDCALFSNLRFYDEQDGDIEVDHIALIPGYGAIIIESKGGQLSFNGQCWLQSNSKGPQNVGPGLDGWDQRSSSSNCRYEREKPCVLNC